MNVPLTAAKIISIVPALREDPINAPTVVENILYEAQSADLTGVGTQYRDALKEAQHENQRLRERERKASTNFVEMEQRLAAMAIERDVAKDRAEKLQESIRVVESICDDLRADKAKAEAALREESEKLTHVLTSLEEGTLPWWQAKHDDLLRKWVVAEAACAEKDEVLRLFDYNMGPRLADEFFPIRVSSIRRVTKALSTECGKGYVSKEAK